MPNQSQGRALLFWMPYVACAAWGIVEFVPRVHAPHSLQQMLMFVALALLLCDFQRFAPSTMPHVLFAIGIALLASGVGIVCLWNSWVVVPMVPAFLLFAFIFFIILRGYWRNVRETQQLLKH